MLQYLYHILSYTKSSNLLELRVFIVLFKKTFNNSTFTCNNHTIINRSMNKSVK